MNRRLLPLVALCLVSATWLGWNLGGRYLWQDEAACAVLARRMLEHGRPLAYDGENLVTMDEYRGSRPAEVIAQHSGDPASAVRWFAENGDYKEDTTWIGQPWGQFVLAGASLALLGDTTVAARLPFVASGVLTVLMLWWFARERMGTRTALAATALLLGNVFWYLHARQCRYYAPATLLCLATFFAYLRWRDGRRYGALAFAASAWTWFQLDFGSPVTVLALFLADALVRAWRARAAPGPGPSLRAVLATFAALGLALAPFVLLYDLGTRYKPTFYPFVHKLWGSLYNVNQFQLPLLALPCAVLVARALRGREGAAREAHAVLLAAGVVLVQAVWMAAVGPAAYYRYVVDCTPLSCLVLAWTFVRGTELSLGRARSGGPAKGSRYAIPVGTLVALQLATPLLAVPFTEVVPARYRTTALHPGRFFRHELVALRHQLANLVTDPNRAAVEYLRPRLQPGDEVLANYEDLPLVFYLDCPVRGGIPAFRVADPGAPPPRFVVWRELVPFVYTEVFVREIERWRWNRTRLDAPSVPWGNTPDPNGYDFTFWRGDEPPLPGVLVYELVGPRER